jgi:antitoxin component of MazEF toxin-antitoxin module
MGIVMNVKVRRLGTSIGVTLPETLVERLGIEAGDDMLVMETDGVIYLSPQDPHFQEAYNDYLQASHALHEVIDELSGRLG